MTKMRKMYFKLEELEISGNFDELGDSSRDPFINVRAYFILDWIHLARNNVQW
jgi:hypothetical protein